MDIAPVADSDLVTQTRPFEPDSRLPSDFASVEEFIASGAFDEAVLRAGKLGVERAVARQKALETGGSADSE
jgi:hypothetical protein